MASIYLKTFFVFLINATAFATIQGYIKDKNTGDPVENVNIVIQNTLWGTTTNKAGQFEVKNIPPGIYDITFSHIGYKTINAENVTVETGKRRIIGVMLQPTVIGLDEIEVSANRILNPPKAHSLAGHYILLSEDITEKAGSIDDPQRSFMFLPGIASRNDLTTNLYIRGSSPDQNLVLFNGLEVS